MTALNVLVTKPEEMTAADLSEFEALVRKGEEVEPHGLSQRIQAAHLLACVRVDSKVIAVAAIKSPSPHHLKDILRKSEYTGVEGCSGDFGYVYVDEEYRGQGVATRLTRSLLAAYKGRVYATTRTDNEPMQAILRATGFEVVGKPWRSTLHADKQIILWMQVGSDRR